MPIYHGLKAIYIHIPKCGGTSVHAALAACDKSVEFYGAANIEQQAKLKTLHLHHLSAALLKGTVSPETWISYYKFAFVRNPWDTMVSYFHYRLRTPPRTPSIFRKINWKYIIVKPKATAEYLMFKIKVQRDYEKIIKRGSGKIAFDYWLRGELEESKPIRDCYYYLHDENGGNLMDYIGDYGSLGAGFEHVAEKIGAPVNLPHLNLSHHERYTAYYDASLRDFVAKRFVRDIERFNFEF